MILEQNQGANTRGKGKEKKVSEEEVSTCRRGPTIGQTWMVITGTMHYNVFDCLRYVAAAGGAFAGGYPSAFVQ